MNYPQNIEAEQAVLGSLLIDPYAINRVGFLKPEYFFLPHHKAIFAACLDVSKAGGQTDIVQVGEALGAKLDDVGGSAYLSSLTLVTPSSINVEHYAKIVYRHGRTTVVIDRLSQLVEAARSGKVGGDDLVDYLDEELTQLLSESGSRNFLTMPKLMDDAEERLRKKRENEGHLVGIGSGFPDLDAYTHGFEPGSLTYIAARPGQGKTSLMMNIAHAMACSGRGSGVFELEMSGDQLADRLIALQSNVPSEVLRTGKLSDLEWGRAMEGIRCLKPLNISICDRPVQISEMRTLAKQMVLQNNSEVIFIDYVGLMLDHRAHNEQQELSAISRGLKSLAKELQVPIIALSQLNREADGVRPELKHLRASGALEQDADVVLMPYRPGAWDDQCETPNLTELLIRKNRHGKEGTAILYWQGDLMRFGSVREMEAPF